MTKAQELRARFLARVEERDVEGLGTRKPHAHMLDYTCDLAAELEARIEALELLEAQRK